MNWRKRIVLGLSLIYTFMLCGAIASHLLWRVAPMGGEGSASFLFLAGALILIANEPLERWRLLLAGSIGFVAEIIGVKTGFIFGQYSYTQVLAPNIFEAPIAMICAWYILIAYVRQMALFVTNSAWKSVILASLWMTGIDLIIDPLAAHPFNYWNWIETGGYYGIPLHNFLGWFVVSLLILGIDRMVFEGQPQKHPTSQWIGLSIIILYTVCSLIYGFYLAAGIGGGLFLVHGLLIARVWMRYKPDNAPPRKMRSVFQ